MVPLPDEEYRLFREWIAEEYGLCFGDERRDLLRARLDACRVELGFDTFRDLYFHLKFHPNRARDRERLLPKLTNNESYFFRERGPLDLLRTEVLPALRTRLRASGERELRILSAACASGEEPYTLAMTVRDSGVFPPPWEVVVIGLDLDEEALDRARCATYGEHAFRGVDPETRARFFREQPSGRWQVAEPLREDIRFAPVNLVEPGWSRHFAPQHVIFCRNVLIYFDRRATERTAEELFQALVPGGYLFLGHAESLGRVSTPLVPVRCPGAVYYRRPDD